MKVILHVITAACLCTACMCSGAEKNISALGFFSPPERIIALLEKKADGPAENFLLASAFHKKKAYRKAMHFFAASAVTDKTFSQKISASALLAFFKNSKNRSEYFDDAVYRTGEILFMYSEYKTVTALTEMMEDSDSGLKRDSVMLEASALVKSGDTAAACRSLEKFIGDPSKSYPKDIMRIRLASIYESTGDIKKAVSGYMAVILPDPRSWQGKLAVRGLEKLIRRPGITLTDKEYLAAAESLAAAKSFTASLELLKKIKSPAGMTDNIALIKVRSLCGMKRLKEASAEISMLSGAPKTQAGLILADGYLSTGRKKDAVKTLRLSADSKIEPWAEEAFQKILSPGGESPTTPLYEKLYEEYTARYPKNPERDTFTWRLARELLQRDRKADADKIFARSLKDFPEGKYSDNFRYHLMETALVEKRHDEAMTMLTGLVEKNPDSSYTWIALEEAAAAGWPGAQAFDIQSAKKKKGGAALANALLFVKEKDLKARDARLKYLDDSYRSRCLKLAGDAEKLKVRPDNKKKLANLEKYFRTGDSQSITREFSFITKDPEDTADKRRALLKFSLAYGNSNLALAAYNELAKSAGISENLFELPMEIVKIILPRPFSGCIEDAADESDIDEALILAVMKSESGFKHDALSTAGAQGIMQTLPATADAAAKSLKMKTHSPYDPCDSIRIGARHLSGLNKTYKKDERMIFAAYNAGGGNLAKWKGLPAVKGKAAFADKIPFDETRLYVLKTARYAAQYRCFYP